jgi:hypothetical protein
MIVYSGTKPASSSLGAHQQGADEQVVPGELVDHAHVDAVLGLRAAEQVRHIERSLSASAARKSSFSAAKCSGRHADVGLAPPHGAFGLVIADDELVLGRAAGVLAGGDHEGAILGQQAFAVRTACSTSGAVPRLAKIVAVRENPARTGNVQAVDGHL